jgi:predicted metalloprotease with PDZ domain
MCCLAVILLSLCTPGALPASAAEGLGYEAVVRIDDPAREFVHIEATLTGLRGPVELALPEHYAFVPVAPRLDGQPSARRGDGHPLALDATSPTTWRLDPGSASDARVSWTVRLDHRRQADVVGRDEYEHPYLAEDHALLVTGAVFLVPQVEQTVALLAPRVRFELPEGWPVYAPWPQASPGVYAPTDLDLVDDLVALGHWHVEAGEVDGLRYAVAFAPGQDDLRDLIARRLPPILEAEVALFGGAPQSDYLFVFGRPDQSSGYGGSPKRNAMTLFVSSDLPAGFAAEGVTHLVAHEYHHTWMKARCEPHDELRFVMEGFTDYYAHVVPWRLGMRDDRSLLLALQEQLASAEGSLARFGGSLVEAGGPSFFEGGAAYQSCYAGGLGLALWTDVALREAGVDEGLDTLLRRFYEDPRWSDGVRPELSHWITLVEDALGATLAGTQRAAVHRAGGPDWVALLDEVGVLAERDVVPVSGGVRANFDGTTLTVLDPTGAGALAGLQAGDRLLQVNGRPVSHAGDVHRAWDVLVDGELRLTYERGGEQVTSVAVPPVQAQFTLPADLPRRLREPEADTDRDG